ncbi:LmbE family protein [Opitutaceae bacterium EW11]|nr:LmbE family protein [Opitutaceae bacterium EW11]
MTDLKLLSPRTLSVLGRFFFVVSTFCLAARVGAADGAGALAAELRTLQQTGSVLYIAAHPDDENTQLIAYLARGRGYRTGYLSVTRGDGGQNVLGPDLGEKLGVARTQELLAARRLDGGRQFFTRAIDFGFSKDYEETLRVWDRQEVLSDIVRVIREFQPDVLVTRFSPQPGGTHGHHTASAVLALEAFKLAGDPKAFPEQLRDLKPWQPKRIFWNAWQGRSDVANALKIDVSGTDPVLGITFAELATRSRSQHKTQGFDKFAPMSSTGPRIEQFHLLAGDPATTDLLDGVDTSWNRFEGGAAVAKLAEQVAARFDPAKPTESLPSLFELRRAFAALAPSAAVEDRRATLDRLIAECVGLRVATTVPNTEVVAGERIPLHQRVDLSAAVPVRWVAVRHPRDHSEVPVGIDLVPGASATKETEKTMPADAGVTQPYWLREQPATGMFRVADTRLIGTPENPPEWPVDYVFSVGGETLVVHDEPVLQGTAPDSPEVRHLAVIAPVSLRFSSEVELLAPGAQREVTVEIAAARPASGSLRLVASEGWSFSPAALPFALAKPGDVFRGTFSVTAPARPDVGRLTAEARVGGRVYDTQRQEVHYPHIHFQLLQPPARARVVSLEIARRGQHLGYVPGAGDTIAENLRQIGYDVDVVNGPDLTPERLKTFDAVVFGVRALNVRQDLAPHMAALFAYVEAGGTVVFQYNNPNGLQVEKIVPYDLHLSADRVTDETAPMTLLSPGHPVLTTPNAISAEDFQGWVQERGLYFPNRWADAFTPILGCNDTGEAPMKGALLVAGYGRGHIVYTGLSFFRQLPAGVPGAYRLFANLVSLGK